MTANRLTVKNIKTFIGREGHGFNVSLYFDGKRAGFAMDDASGGPVDVQWASYDMQKAVLAYVATLPPTTAFGSTFPTSIDVAIENAINAAQAEKQLAAARKKFGVIFQLPGDEAGTYRTCKTTRPMPVEALRAELLKKYPDMIEL